MVAFVSLIVTLTLSLVVNRVATVALMLTGLSREAARFQARSAFTGCGFNTTESETATNHPVRRRIIMLLMLWGNVGIVTLAATLVASLLSASSENLKMYSLVLLALSLVTLWVLATSTWLDKHLTRLIGWALKRWTKLEIRDYVQLFHLANGYAVFELMINPGDWVAHKTLADVNLSSEGVLVLGIHRADGSYIGAPRGKTVMEPNDTLVLYGPEERLSELDRRQAGIRGAWAHLAAIASQSGSHEEPDTPTSG